MNKDIIIKGLLDLGAIKLSPNDPFTWTSGIKSPIYCDNRLTIGKVKLRKEIAKQLAQLVKENYGDVQLIGACATAGIPHGTSVADILDLDLIYFRSKPKEHGTNSKIEGYFEKNKKIVIIEDLISTGKSVVDAVKEAQKEGLEVIGVVSIFTYGLNKSKDSLKQCSVEYKSLITIDDLLNYTKDEMSSEEQNIIKDFIKKLNP